MQITVVGRHFDVTEPIKKYADSKLLKFERYWDKIKEAHVILEVQKFRHIAEITMYLKYFKLTATEETRDMYASIDNALGSLHKQLLKLRDKVKEHKARRVSRKSVFFGELLGGEQMVKITDKGRKRNIIKKTYPLKPMSVGEAADELELFKDNFLVFRNADTEAVNVIYKREDGNYGLIEPE